MASFIAKIFGGGDSGGSTPAPAPAPAPVTKKAPVAGQATRARTRSKYAGAMKERRAADDAKVAKKKLLGD